MKLLLLLIFLILVSIYVYYLYNENKVVKKHTIKRNDYLIQDSAQAVTIFKAYLESYNYLSTNDISKYKCELYKDSFWIVNSYIPNFIGHEPLIVLNRFNGEVIEFIYNLPHKAKSLNSLELRKHIDTLLLNSN